ncbi:MAG: hypothetical protein IBJ10_09250 [Phycisphaerales bacterium]|nr:hypothetical protein [Phycisphaerales bacterium]
MTRAELESAFHEAMLGVYARARDEAGYNATRFLVMVRQHGGVATAKTLMSSQTPSEGCIELLQRGRADLSVEALVADPKWSSLFDEDQIRRARERLPEGRSSHCGCATQPADRRP